VELIRVLTRRMQESLFAIPVAVIAACAAVAIVLVRLDDTMDGIGDLPLVLSASVQGGRTIAASVAGGTITVAAVVFSITALMSQIATSQYSPRAVAGFLDDRFQQVVLGFVVGTFVFAIVVMAWLGSVTDIDQATRPSLAVTATALFGVASAVAIVAYIDHSLRRMRIDSVVRRIAESTVDAIRRQDRSHDATARLEDRPQPKSEPTRLAASGHGWVQSIDAARLAETLPAGSFAAVAVRIGEAVSAGDLLMTVWPADGNEEAARPDSLERSIRTGRVRLVAGDPAYGIRQLVDIALRALSPGVNDPSTAVDVIHLLKLPIREILTLDPARRVYTGPAEQRVFLTEAPSRSDHVHAAFGEVRLAAANQPAVLRALIEILVDLIEELERNDLEARTTALYEEVRLVIETASAAEFPEPDFERAIEPARALDLAPPPDDVELPPV
jgi:uncharacterized membrane protein